MKQFAIVGLGAFGIRMLEELLEITNEIIIIDRDKDVIEKYKDFARASYITDAINETALRKIVPLEIDAVIVDLGGKIESSIMTINFLHKMGIREIVAKAQTDEHGEILKLMGATKVIYPDREAAKRITPILASSLLFDFMPISQNLSLAEIRANEYCIGKTLMEANLRKEFSLNVVALRKEDSDEFTFINDPSYAFAKEDVLLVAGAEEDIFAFSRDPERQVRRDFRESFRKLFSKK